MNSGFVQFSYKFNMLLSTKLQLARLYSTKQGTKATNYYDTLKITPHATQHEVKSAYYKLTLQYHPDKNKTEYAKQKFQDISEAYEVLSNYEQRKTYDRGRGIQSRRQPMSTTYEEPLSHTKVYTGSSKIYNFDAWTHAHYGQQLEADLIRKKKYREYKAMDMDKRSLNNDPKYMEVAIFLLTLTMLGFFFREKTDVPASERHKRESKYDES